MDSEPRINFQELLQEIADSGLNDSEVAKLVEVSQPTITRLRNGVARQPKTYELGAALVALHKRRCKRRHRKSAARAESNPN